MIDINYYFVRGLRMFLSRLSDIAEPRDRIQRDSRIFKQFKISCHKIEILALVFDLLLVVLASTFGSTIYQYVWHENFATAKPVWD